LIRNPVCQITKLKAQHQKNNRLIAETIDCLYQYTNIKTEFKELREKENAHRDLYWFTLNLELHLVFSETNEEFH